MKASPKDSLYVDKQESISDFVFDAKVANVFDDMINRSVPGYRDVVAMIGVLANQYVEKGSLCYDLGCSLGAVSNSILENIKHSDFKIIAVDKSKAMIERCRKNLKEHPKFSNVELLDQDIQELSIQEASFVVLNFTLQFITPENRASILKRIYEGMNEKGVLILSEKLTFETEAEKAVQIDLHETFKKLNGYSDMEISQKRTALENVLIPCSLSEYQNMLKEAGFQTSYLWFQCFNFASLIAFK